MFQLQTTALTTLIGTIILFGAGIIIGQRLKQAAAPTLRPIRLFQRFFTLMGIFFLIMWLPNILLASNPNAFPPVMAWGYVIAHIALYAAFTTVALMLCVIVPRFAGKERWVIMAGIIYGTLMTLVNAITMIWGTQPTYNYQQSVVQYNAAPPVGAGIGLMALCTIFPAAVLFLINAFRNPAQRLRSGLLGIGFVLMTFGGPLHDVAVNWQMYAIADLVTTVSVIIAGIGVLYRLDQSLSLGRAAAPAPATVGQLN